MKQISIYQEPRTLSGTEKHLPNVSRFYSYVPGSVLGPGDATVNKTDMVFSWGFRGNTHLLDNPMYIGEGHRVLRSQNGAGWAGQAFPEEGARELGLKSEEGLPR